MRTFGWGRRSRSDACGSKRTHTILCRQQAKNGLVGRETNTYLHRAPIFLRARCLTSLKIAPTNKVPCHLPMLPPRIMGIVPARNTGLEPKAVLCRVANFLPARYHLTSLNSGISCSMKSSSSFSVATPNSLHPRPRSRSSTSSSGVSCWKKSSIGTCSQRRQEGSRRHCQSFPVANICITM